MGNTTASDPSWQFRPVNPLELWQRLADALGVRAPRMGHGAVADAETVTSLPHPDPAMGNFRDLYLLKEVLRKYPSFELGIDTAAVAQAAFEADEVRNRQTNDRLTQVDPLTADVDRVIYAASVKIAKVLGRFDVQAFVDGWRFGPGSTITVPRKEAQPYVKIQNLKPAVTPAARELMLWSLLHVPQWHVGGPSLPDDPPLAPLLCQYDRWTSVTKNARTDRGIGIPPDLNVMGQLSVGTMMRTKLARVGIDLSDQTVNQRLAPKASLDGESATVDVSGASQSLTCGLVYRMLGSLPASVMDPRWYAVMEKLRAPFTLLPARDGRSPYLHENELFSAMGNGYTFELETLIFWALSSAVCDQLGIPAEVSCYGDDIILPSCAVGALQRVFDVCGFRLNMAKSFFSTERPRFRESCGKHYLDGCDVTPFYVDTPLDQIESIVLLANNLHRWSIGPLCRDGRMYAVWQWVLSHLPVQMLRRRIPLGEANDGIISDWDDAVPPSCVYLENAGKGQRLYYEAGIVQQSFDPAVVEPALYGRTFVGYRVYTASIGNRLKAMGDDERYTTTLYDKSVRKYRPPAKADILSRLEALWPDITPPKEKEDGKTSLILGRRVVITWPRLGPWMIDGVQIASGKLIEDTWRMRQVVDHEEDLWAELYRSHPRIETREVLITSRCRQAPPG